MSAQSEPKRPKPDRPEPDRPPGWITRHSLRLPRRTIRLRLTLLYGGLFLISGASLLAITYVLVSRQGPHFATDHRFTAGATVAGRAVPTSATLGPVWPGPLARASAAGTCPAYQRREPLKPAQAARCLAFVRSIASQQRAAELRQLLIESGIALSIMTVASIGLGYLVAGRVLRPLRTITTAARSVSATSLHERLLLPGPDDELKELGDTFDALLGRLEAAFAAQRQFVANASHEMRSPLARQRTMLEVALADPEPSVSALRDVCERVLAAGEQQERLIEALLTLARSQRGLDRRETIDLAAITGEVVATRQADASQRTVAVRTQVAQTLAMGDANLAERLVANLIDNAVRHNVAQGTVDVSVRPLADRAVISVANTGPVIASHEVTRLFQPFQRGCAGRTAGRDGLGLGLSIVGAIAQAHGAWLQATAQPDGGLSIDIGFPVPVQALPLVAAARS